MSSGNRSSCFALARLLLSFVAVSLVLVPGCSVYRSSYQYFPRPLEAQVELKDGGVGARALFSVIGIRREDKEVGRPSEVEIRVRIENRSPGRVSFVKDSLLLLSADLQPFETSRVVADHGFSIDSSQAANFDLFFPVPDEDQTGRELDLDGLNLRLALSFETGGEVITVGSTFERDLSGEKDGWAGYTWRSEFSYRSWYCY